MTAAELMKPRFEVVAAYPDCPHEIGSILEARHITHSSIHITTTQYTDEFGENIRQQNHVAPDEFEKYPHLFRKLNWWENRKEEDMPTRLISRFIPDNTEVYIIEGWDMELMLGWLNWEKRECCSLLTFSPEYGYFPVD